MKEYVLSKECPPIYEKLNQKFGVNWNDGLIIADFPNIHCKFEMPPQKVWHEIVHLKQQEKMGKELWWSLYLAKDSFRLEQEVEAFAAEYRFVRENIADRNQVFEYLYHLAQQLSSEMYGKIVTGDEAMRLIQTPKK